MNKDCKFNVLISKIEEIEQSLEKEKEYSNRLQNQIIKTKLSNSYILGDSIIEAFKFKKKSIYFISNAISILIDEYKKKKRITKCEDNNTLILNNYIYKPKSRILYVIHNLGGGTPKTNKDLIRNIISSDLDAFLLIGTGKSLELYSCGEYDKKICEWYLDSNWDIITLYRYDFYNIYNQIIKDFDIDIIHIRHTINHTFDIFKVSKSLKKKLVLSFHDFYYICPTINLVDNNEKYCVADCNYNKKCRCDYIRSRRFNLSRWVIDTWRKNFENILNYCDVFITTSNYTKLLYVKIFPKLCRREFLVIEHGRDIKKMNLKPLNFDRDNKIRILFPGNITINKGSKVIEQLVNLDNNRNLEIYIIGNCDRVLKPYIYESRIIYLGEYDREDFYRKVEFVKPHFIGIFSIWPETYCHTLTEAWSCGIPTIVNNIGTLSERAKRGSVVVDINDIDRLYSIIVKSFEYYNYSILCEELEQISIRSTKDMSSDYYEIYSKLLDKD